MGSTMKDQQRRAWWKESSVYHIYPASFQDSTGSGAGDLKGIISRVDYLAKLGVDIVWLSPIFESPLVDMGYDVSNYIKVDPRYGDNSDIDVLINKLHERGMKLVLDLVVNHTSDQHEWFKESRKSKDNPFRDWYIWKPPRYDENGNRQPPNNWVAHFSGSTWEYDEASDEYYLHLFTKEQPDLNWENPDVRAKVHEIMRFWLDRGCDGFRLDVINFISKDQAFPDSKSPTYSGAEFYACGPRCHEFLKEIGTILQEYDAFSVGEMPCVDDEKELIKAVAADRGELSMIFHFELMSVDNAHQGLLSRKEWLLKDMKKVVHKWQRFMYDNDGWNALYLENHDQPRAISRFARDEPDHRADSAKMIAIFHGFQAGTSFVYQGQEIGMTNVPKDWPMEEYKDVLTINHWAQVKDGADEAKKERVRADCRAKARDNARTPMQWSADAQAGFTTSSTPWMRVNDNYTAINVAAQVDDPDSVFNCYRRVLEKRKELVDLFVYGDFALVDEPNPRIFAYKRTASSGDMALIACNFSKDRVDWKFDEGKVKEVLVSPGKKSVADVSRGIISLESCEGIALLL